LVLVLLPWHSQSQAGGELVRQNNEHYSVISQEYWRCNRQFMATNSSNACIALPQCNAATARTVTKIDENSQAQTGSHYCTVLLTYG